MKREKETSHQQLSRALNVRRHRTKQDIFVIDGALMVEDDPFIQGKKTHRSSAHPPIDVRLVISEEDLHRLLGYAVNYESDFSSQFSALLADAIRQSQRGARGKHKGHETTLFWIKHEASFLHTLFSFINDSDVKPGYFQDLIENIPSDDREALRRFDRRGRDRGYDPIALTAYRMEKLYGGKKLKTMGLKPFYSGNDNLDSFYITYIQPGRKQSETSFKDILKPILLRRSGVRYLRRKGESRPFVFTNVLARRNDIVPCDEKGKKIEVRPLGKKNQHYKKAVIELFEEIRKEALFDITF